MIKQYLYNIFLLGCAVTGYTTADTLDTYFAYAGQDDHSALLGVKQGLIEANLQGRFLGQSYQLDTFSATDIDKQDFAKYIAILTTLDNDLFIYLAKKYKNTPIFNLNIEDNALRAACINNALHIIPSHKMKQDALAQWQKKQPNSKAHAKAWHPDFKKFAARDLNKRFMKNFNTPMEDDAWAGWAAVKMTADSIARGDIKSPEAVLRYLKTMLSFDGQKGTNMTFRETGQLRQPLLLIDNNKIIAEAPIRGIANPPTVDSLGILNCK